MSASNFQSIFQTQIFHIDQGLRRRRRCRRCGIIGTSRGECQWLEGLVDQGFCRLLNLWNEGMDLGGLYGHANEFSQGRMFLFLLNTSQ